MPIVDKYSQRFVHQENPLKAICQSLGLWVVGSFAYSTDVVDPRTLRKERVFSEYGSFFGDVGWCADTIANVRFVNKDELYGGIVHTSPKVYMIVPNQQSISCDKNSFLSFSYRYQVAQVIASRLSALGLNVELDDSTKAGPVITRAFVREA